MSDHRHARRGPVPRFRRRLVLLACSLLASFTLLAAPAFAFPDVPADQPYAAAIDGLAARGIISGHNDGTFGPDEPVSRCQFAKMIVNTLAIPHTDLAMPFTDVGPGDLPEFVAAVGAHGITNGTNEAGTLFSPWRQASRAQVITMVVRGMGNAHPDLLAPRWDLSPWGYFDQIHGEPAAVAYANRLLDGLPVPSLDPWAPMPRGEVAQVLHNVLVEIGWDPLAAVRELAPGNIRLVELRSQTADAPPVRLLVPALDGAAIAELLAAVAAISPVTSGLPDNGPPEPLLMFLPRTTDDRELGVFTDDSGGVALNLTIPGRSRSIVGVAPAVTALARRYLAQLVADAARGNPDSELPAAMPDDFGFVAAYGVMARNVLDTFGGTFSKDLISSNPSTAGTTLHLGEPGLQEIYGLLREMGATTYPVTYVPPDTGMYGTPHSSYYLRFRAAGQVTEIRWENYNYSQEKRALDLLQVMGRIQSLVEATDQYKSLPPTRGGYM